MDEKKNYCGKCGNVLTDGNKYCVRCGYINDQNLVNEVTTQNIEEEKKEVPTSAIVFLIISIIPLVVLVPFIIVCIIALLFASIFVGIDLITVLEIFLFIIPSIVMLVEAIKNYRNKGGLLKHGIIVSVVTGVACYVISLIISRLS